MLVSGENCPFWSIKKAIYNLSSFFTLEACASRIFSSCFQCSRCHDLSFEVSSTPYHNSSNHPDVHDSIVFQIIKPFSCIIFSYNSLPLCIVAALLNFALYNLVPLKSNQTNLGQWYPPPLQSIWLIRCNMK